MTAICYILDQNDRACASLPFGKVTVGYGGCGPIAVYNAMLTAGQPRSFDAVLSWFREKPRRTFLHGRLGVLPCQLKACLRHFGFRVKTARSSRRIAALSKEADACILHYYFPCRIRGIPLPAAHYVEFTAERDGYLARNTGARGGISRFAQPAAYGRFGQRFLPLAIFLYRT